MRSTPYHGSPTGLLGLEIAERAAGAAFLYYLPHLLESRVGSAPEAVRVAAYYGAGTYSLAVAFRVFRVPHAWGLRVGAGLMAVGAAVFLWKVRLAIWLSCLLFAAGAAAWKTNLLPSYGALGGNTGHLHAAIAGGYLVGIPLFGMLLDPVALVLVVAGTFGLVLAGTCFVDIAESPAAKPERGGDGFGYALAMFLALVPITMLTYVPLLSFSPHAIRLAESVGWNKGVFGLLLLMASCVSGVVLRTNDRILVWVGLVLSLIACWIFAMHPSSVSLVLIAHLLMGVADATLHQFLYPVALRNKNGTTAYFVTVGLGQVLIALTAAVDPKVMIAAMAILGLLGSAVAYRVRPLLSA